MKKILLLSVVVAGFVSVASADSLYCPNNRSNQCCHDIVDMYHTGHIDTIDGYTVTSFDQHLISDGTTGSFMCETNGNYTNQDGDIGHGTFQWLSGSWQFTLKCTQSVNNKCELNN